uniref:Uncharacterized protein LOC105852408 n=1 Tax=Cicer arietinum TaxID=3827 RepID=A0A1S3EC74_CICAR|nr:uncharacterized protein LOC105852408 [Cicer arietinum]
MANNFSDSYETINNAVKSNRTKSPNKTKRSLIGRMMGSVTGYWNGKTLDSFQKTVDNAGKTSHKVPQRSKGTSFASRVSSYFNYKYSNSKDKNSTSAQEYKGTSFTSRVSSYFNYKYSNSKDKDSTSAQGYKGTSFTSRVSSYFNYKYSNSKDKDPTSGVSSFVDGVDEPIYTEGMSYFSKKRLSKKSKKGGEKEKN